MIRALEAIGMAWLMMNVALFLLMNREDAQELFRTVIDYFKYAIGLR